MSATCWFCRCATRGNVRTLDTDRVACPRCVQILNLATVRCVSRCVRCSDLAHEGACAITYADNKTARRTGMRRAAITD